MIFIRLFSKKSVGGRYDVTHALPRRANSTRVIYNNMIQYKFRVHTHTHIHTRNVRA